MRAPGRLLHTAALFAAFAAAPAALASERILSFESLVTVEKSGTLTVTETITVLAEGKKIKRGIYRDFPTRYRDRAGNNYTVGFELLSVTRDGLPEPHHIGDLDNGVRVYVGESNAFLQPGKYAYTLTYRSNRQIGFFDTHDELYWNATGNDWPFSIDQATVRVKLPATVPVSLIEFRAYTGPPGSSANAYTAQLTGEDMVRFATTAALAPGEGITVVVGWPKYHVDAPSRAERLGFFLRDQLALVIGAGGLALLLLYYLASWHFVGRDPKQGVIIPRFAPPDGLSPAAVRYILKMRFDNRVFAVALISMAVKGRIRIRQPDNDETIIERDDSGSSDILSFGEKTLYKALLSLTGAVRLNNTNHKAISSARKKLKSRLSDEYHATYFFQNLKWLIPGLTISVIMLVGIAVAEPEQLLLSGMPMIFLSVFLLQAGRLWKQGRRLIAGVVFLVSGFVVTAQFGFSFIGEINLAFALVVILLFSINTFFYFLLKAPTRLGRKTMDEIEGFRKYLGTAEADRLNMLTPPEQTPELYEKYLPYALALDVEQEWSKNFSEVLARAAQSGDSAYQPRWYHGSSWDAHDPANFGNSLGSSLSSTVASAASPPGSSSGFSGGSSGGGGGGGGGGGW